jgi:hypothetical protein
VYGVSIHLGCSRVWRVNSWDVPLFEIAGPLFQLGRLWILLQILLPESGLKAGPLFQLVLLDVQYFFV